MSLRSMTMVWALLAASSASASTDLDWLQGDWCGERKGVQNEEHWGSAKAGVMLGWHRDTRDGKLVGFEFMRITFDAEGIRFHAQPGGQAGNDLPGHDFPKRVTYRREADGRLFARVDDGRDDGAAMEWTWSRCAADGD